MDENESKDEIKFLGNKRKLDHENIVQKKDEDEKINQIINIDNKDIINTSKEENKNNLNLVDSSANQSEKDKDLISKGTLDDICQICGMKNKLNIFKKVDDIYNYLLTNKKGNKEDIFKILEEKSKNYEFKQEKKICENCINYLVKDKNIFEQFLSKEQDNNPNNNIIKELVINKNVDLNKKIENTLDNKNIVNTVDENKAQAQKVLYQNTINKIQSQEEKTKFIINNLMNQNNQDVMSSANLLEQIQNRNNYNIPLQYINPYVQNNPNMQINPQVLDILTQNAINNRNIQNMNPNPQNINNINANKNATSQIPYQFLLNNPNPNQNLDNNNINDRINQLIKNNTLYGHTNIFNFGNNNSKNKTPNNNKINNINNLNNINNNINNQNNINPNLNRNNLNNNLNNNMNANTNTNVNANTNNNNNNFEKFENDLEIQLNNLKECINIQNTYFNQLLALVVKFYEQVVTIKQLNEQNKLKNNIPYNLLNTLGGINPNNNININMNPAYVLQQQSFQNYFPNIMNNNLNPSQLNNLNNPNINFNNNKNEKKDENNISNFIKKNNNNSNININNINNDKEKNLEINDDIKTNINELPIEETNQNKEIKENNQEKNINDSKILNESSIEIINKCEEQNNENININDNKNEQNNIQK